ncbi:hypothetical protein [Cellvibrio sp. QJXJ]|uniref:hypothetical protein n=1 Tax=Cellvibrio sp. QJXJ TaxID=2964606 RepID=UPI0021C4969D|nr:hypothetical protein [Cellvibrio sp. QJXJ]UUA72567.1 hypothetical protein NNX04_19450 [Cellvibrio sp. QJXJ]
MRIIAIMLITVFVSACSLFQRDYEIVYCQPGNKPVTVYRDPTKSYSPYVRELEGGFEGLKTTLNEVDAELGIGKGDIKLKVQHLENKLDQESIRLRLSLQTAALAMNISPCDAKDLFNSQLTQLSKTLNTISNVQNQINDAVVQSAGKSDPEKDQIINTALEKAAESLDAVNNESASPSQKKSFN